MELSRSLGQFFTPPEVVDLAFELLLWLAPDLHRGRLLDLSCGEGAFLLGARRSGWAPRHLYGLDADDRLPGQWLNAAWGARWEGRPNLAVADGLWGGGRELFEAVVGNPPFGGQLAAEPAVEARYRWWRLGQRRQAALPRELWFLERSVALLRPGGYLAMVLPEGLLANRRWLVQRQAFFAANTIEAVVGLPRSVFRTSRAAVKTVLVLARRAEAPQAHSVRLAELAPDELVQAGQRLIAAWQQGPPPVCGRPWE